MSAPDYVSENALWRAFDNWLREVNITISARRPDLMALRKGDYIAVNGELRIVTKIVSTTCLSIRFPSPWQRFVYWWLYTALPTIRGWNPCNEESR